MALFVQLKPGRVHLHAGQKILRAEEYLTLVEADRLVAAAEVQTEAILTQAREVFVQEQARGYQDGQETAKLEMVEQMVETVGKTIDYFSGVEHKVADVVMSAVRKILADFDDVELTLRVIKNALNVVRNQRQITLRVAPEQLEAVRGRIHEIMSGYPSIGFIDVTPDPRLSRGGCILESEMGIVDAGVEVQLEALERAIRRSLGSQEQNGAAVAARATPL